MATKLEKTLKREISVAGRAYIVTLSPDELLITLKGHRKGKSLRWKDLIGDDAALATALNASLGLFEKQQASSVAKVAPRKRARRKS
jgi:hypothetical protein